MGSLNNFLVSIYHFSGPIISTAPALPSLPPSNDLENSADFFSKRDEPYLENLVESGGHWIVAILGSKGHLDFEQAREIYGELFPNRSAKEKHLGAFDSLDEIEIFMALLCDKLQMERAALCSVVEYNAIIENLTTLEINDPSRPNLAQILFSKTREIKLPENSKRKGIFGKLFH